MRRIFLAQPLSPQMEVTGADAHHLAHAMRARSGERLLVTDSEGHSAEVQIAGFAAGKVLLRLVRCMEETHEPPCCVELFQCLPKGDKMDFIVQKATELGAARLHPVMSRNAVVRYDEKKARARAARWQKVAAEAVKQCGCHDFILDLENGYDTICGGAGGHLSGGERQRIAVARAMLKDAAIVILDEATSYTDPESEAVMQSALAKLVAGKTVLMIAHRLSTIADADRIFVVNNGEIAAQGGQAELLEGCALYRKMWNAHLQVRDTDEEVTAC